MLFFCHVNGSISLHLKEAFHYDGVIFQYKEGVNIWRKHLESGPGNFLSTFGGHCLHCLHLHIALATGPWIDSFLPFLSFVFPVKPDAGDMVLSLLPELVAFFPFLVTRGWHRRYYGEQRGENLMMSFKLFLKILPPAQDVQNGMHCKPTEIFSSLAFSPVWRSALIPE